MIKLRNVVQIRKISKKKINFDDLKKKYPINYPVIASPEEIELMAKKSGKNKIIYI